MTYVGGTTVNEGVAYVYQGPKFINTDLWGDTITGVKSSPLTTVISLKELRKGIIMNAAASGPIQAYANTHYIAPPEPVWAGDGLGTSTDHTVVGAWNQIVILVDGANGAGSLAIECIEHIECKPLLGMAHFATPPRTAPHVPATHSMLSDVMSGISSVAKNSLDALYGGMELTNKAHGAYMQGRQLYNAFGRGRAAMNAARAMPAALEVAEELPMLALMA